MALPVNEQPSNSGGEYNPEPTTGGGGTGTPGIGETYAGTPIFDFDIDKAEASSILEVIVYANLSSPDDIQFTGYLVLDGTVRQSCVTNIVLDTRTSNGRMPLCMFFNLAGVSAGAHNVKFVVRNQEVDNVNLSILPGATIFAREKRQGAF